MRYGLLFLSLVFAGSLQAQIVSTTYGQLQGSTSGAVYQFLGVPFASAPVGSLRWKAPQPPAIWTGARAATQFAPMCPQNMYEQGDTTSQIVGDEDCLYLNIWTPRLGADTLPVMVFIHGGGNQQGSAQEMNGGTYMYDGKNMAERGPAVVVTIQYRLGPLGFLVHPGLDAESAAGKSGNYAVLDQILALQWIKDNISGFGGDTSKVMIFGESAGGVNVGNLLLTPLSEGLFQRACIQSASPVIASYADASSKGQLFVDGFISTGTPAEKIAHMRTLSGDSIVSALSSPLAGGVVQMNWQAVRDEIVFTEYALTLFQSGNFHQVPLMIGSNADEMSLSAPPTVLPIAVTALINTRVPQALRPQANALYPPGTNSTQARQSYVGILTDAQFTSTTRRVARCVSENQSEPVWRYFFTHKHTLPQLQSLGSYHGMELFYVFNNWENATLGSGFLFKPQDDSVQKNMLAYWVSFANSGNPNGSTLPLWPDYDAFSDCYLELKATPSGASCGLRTAQSDLWDDVAGFSACEGVNAVEELNTDLGLRLSPNPARGIYQLRAELDAPAHVFLSLLDMQGKTLLSEHLGRQPAGVFQKNLYLPDALAAGMYRVVLLTDGSWEAKGLVVE